jgi:hypothetical protein
MCVCVCVCVSGIHVCVCVCVCVSMCVRDRTQTSTFAMACESFLTGHNFLRCGMLPMLDSPAGSLASARREDDVCVSVCVCA